MRILSLNFDFGRETYEKIGIDGHCQRELRLANSSSTPPPTTPPFTPSTISTPNFSLNFPPPPPIPPPPPPLRHLQRRVCYIEFQPFQIPELEDKGGGCIRSKQLVQVVRELIRDHRLYSIISPSIRGLRTKG